jgi:hypothetical protein
MTETTMPGFTAERSIISSQFYWFTQTDPSIIDEIVMMECSDYCCANCGCCANSGNQTCCSFCNQNCSPKKGSAVPILVTE